MIERLFILGKNSSLYQLHRDTIRNFSETHGIELIELDRFWENKVGTPLEASSPCIVYLDPKGAGYEFVHRRVIERFTSIQLISSSAVLCPDLSYSYVNRKVVLEAIYKASGASIWRIGAHHFNRNISEMVPITRDIHLLNALKHLCKVDGSVVNCFEFIENDKTAYFFISAFYGRLWRKLPRKSLLRPIDAVLKMCGFSGYGYSFYCRD